MTGVISKDSIEEIRARSDIVDVIGRFVKLQRAGGNYRALCPFHREKTPSFNVSPARQGFYCFGCGKGGDVFRFVMDFENVDFVTATRMLAEWAGVTLALDRTAAGSPSGPRKDLLYRLHTELALWYHRQLMSDPNAKVARDYLAGRQLHSDTAVDFMIGYAPNDWDAVLNWGHGRSFTDDDLVAAGVVVRREQDGRCYDRFRDRLMFPIRDEQQRVIAFSGRALRDEDKSAKYINSPETVLFRKNRVLFGLDRARRAVLESREAIICEGQIDVIRCHLAGFQTAVAAQGTAFTEEHAVRLARLADGVVLVFDADNAGREAAIKTAVICLQHGLAVRVAGLPPGDDPDSLIQKHGAGRFGEILGQAGDVLDFRLDELIRNQDAGTEIGMRTVTRGIADLVNAVRDPLQRDRMLRHAAQRLVVDPSLLDRSFRSSTQDSTARDHETREIETEAGAGRRSDFPAAEWSLLEHLASDRSLAGLVAGFLPPRLMSHQGCRLVLELLLSAIENGADDLLGYCSRQGPEAESIQPLLAAVLMSPSRVTGREFSQEDAVKDLILKIWREHLRERLQHLLRKASEGKDDAVRMECAHLRTDIKRLGQWASGQSIIEMLYDED